MADFVHDFWSWWIIILTVASIVFCFWLVLGTRGGKAEQAPAEIKTTDHVWDEDLREYNNPLPKWWLNLFLITLVFGVIYLLLYPGLGSFQGYLNWSQTQRYEDEMQAAEETFGPIYAGYAGTAIPELAENNEAMATAERLFASYCTTCHGSDARGAPGFPNLRDGAWLWGGEPERIKETILQGRTGVMPPWRDALGGDEGVADVTEYVISLSGRDHYEDQAGRGEEKFNQLCIACHLPTGTGNTALGAPDLTDNVWLYGGAREDIASTIGDGRTGHMPPHGDFLGEDRVHLLAAYVYSIAER